jgi:CMP-N,N'-diacetyllegionaminic acid synthase
VLNKNVRTINGHPLIAWSIRQALEVPSITHVVVSTDSEEIAAIAREYGAETPFIRPKELAQDHTPTEPVMSHAIGWYETHGIWHDAVILLQPTSPLRFSGSLQRAVKCFEAENASSLLSVCESHAFFWRKYPRISASYDFENRPRRQDILPEQRWYRETGSVYITRLDSFKIHQNRLVEHILPFQMEEAESHEIDTEFDFVLIENLMRFLSIQLPNLDSGRHPGGSR